MKNLEQKDKTGRISDFFKLAIVKEFQSFLFSIDYQDLEERRNLLAHEALKNPSDIIKSFNNLTNSDPKKFNPSFSQQFLKIFKNVNKLANKNENDID